MSRFDAAFEAYREAATELYATGGDELAQATVPAVEQELEQRVGRLIVKSAALEEAATTHVTGGDADAREIAYMQLSALAALDFAAADDLLRALVAEEGGALAQDVAPSTFASAYDELSVVLGIAPDLGYSQLLADRPEQASLDVDAAAARQELLDRSGRAVDEIIQLAAGGVSAAVDGLAGMSGATLLKSLSQTADLALGELARRVKRLVRLAVKLIANGVGKLLRLLGPQLEKLVRERVTKWLADVSVAKVATTGLGWLYERELLKARAVDIIESAREDGEAFTQVKAQLDELVGRFGWHARILNWIAKALGVLQGKLMALAPYAPIAIGAVWSLVLGYAVLMGGDHLDWVRLGESRAFDLVLGVIRTIETGLEGVPL